MNVETAFSIFQLKAGEQNRFVAFQDFDNWKQQEVQFSDERYSFVYQGACGTENSLKDSVLLEFLFEKFNLNPPSDYHGRSMSVSDVVRISSNAKSRLYYAENEGWHDLTDQYSTMFIPEFSG